VWQRIGVSLAVLLTLTSAALAQRKQPPEKFSPRPVQVAPSAQMSPAANPQQMPTVSTPWTKFCGKDNSDPRAKPMCLTAKEVRLETGKFLAGAALIEPAGNGTKVLRITLPPDVQRAAGTRMSIDGEAPRSGSYGPCIPNGCMADFEVDAEFVASLKSGQYLHLEGTSLPGEMMSYLLPLGDFAWANEGPSTDPVQFEKDRRRDFPLNRSR
jgi:invasion protein IalB